MQAVYVRLSDVISISYCCRQYEPLTDDSKIADVAKFCKRYVCKGKENSSTLGDFNFR